jgi:hypothetical protein
MSLPSGETAGAKGALFYDDWMGAKDLPVYRGHFVPDIRTVELRRWEERQCDAAFIQLIGQEGLSEARITEIAPGQTLPPYRMAIDEIVYVVAGNGLTRLWSGLDQPADGHAFEWSERALFLVPAHQSRQFANMRGDTPVRLLHYNYLPLAMSLVPDPDFFFQNPYEPRSNSDEVRRVFSDARLIADGSGSRWRPGSSRAAHWYGNFFPDMRSWDKLDSNEYRGAGGSTVRIQFADSAMSCHMSVFDATKYKKAHRHGPGRVIVIPSGEGYSVMWRKGDERVMVPWQENALFVPPDRWFHQHFNLGHQAARYLALHPPTQFHGYAEKAEDQAKDQIEYPNEDPWIRQHFEEELAARGLRSGMPDGAYEDAAYAWPLARMR